MLPCTVHFWYKQHPIIPLITPRQKTVLYTEKFLISRFLCIKNVVYMTVVYVSQREMLRLDQIQDVLNLGLDVPTMYLVPRKRFDRLRGINFCEVEFPTVCIPNFSANGGAAGGVHKYGIAFRGWIRATINRVWGLSDWLRQQGKKYMRVFTAHLRLN